MATNWDTRQIPSQVGRVAVVTGASSGLGLETAVALAGAGAKVVMACRNPAKAADALAQVKRRRPNADAELMALDLADLASVRRFASEFASRHSRLDLLINNAGVMAVPFQKTADGFEMQIGTNHFGHFALTGLLLEKLVATKDSRIVNLASLAHRWTRGMNLEDPNFERARYNKWDAYGKSKLANLLFTFELVRRLQASAANVVVAAAHPGYSSTNLQFVGPQQAKSSFGSALMKIGNSLFGQSAAMGALPTLYAATAPDVGTGDYYGPGGFQQIGGYPVKVGCRKAARDVQTAAQLWTVSEKLTSVKYL
ncbi:NAD(P)-dependent dehydrogenase (short-subunit alcohol dehydrogenase family) [Panacagrimonas perspica]|uniref:NAD(P)-dependent dehydrogenase (Short-subunit alcohol dehydrogenase family) n=1 Tax=Panacagrimonas perspica TaxID=381431 RepID=A0A4R7P0N4_9GAMM|nr:oxidoreductase [Panacagrimonas perspica]TDU26631.1 NAD(P)-dependent dehydrogenase (short-subunit alcohol dehydrogenase family) [Panacagrimonas perspica]THD03988.1 short-chain dehydrogenase [Panacagrimonas perspica]